MQTRITNTSICYLLGLLSILYSTLAFTAAPSAQNVSVSTPQGVPLDIDLSKSIIGGDGELSISVPSPPSESQGTVSIIDALVIQFTPAVDFKGIVQFAYQVNDTSNPQTPASATITVTVAETNDKITSVITQEETPSDALGELLDVTCPGLQDVNIDELNQAERDLLARCNDLLAASAQGLDAEVLAALQQIAPEEIAAQIRASRSVSERQMDNISGRLSTLRRGSGSVSLAGLTLQPTGSASINGELLNNAFITGGSAGDTINGPWGLFISGVIGRAERDATEQEDGFTFDSMGTTMGVDYRFSDTLVAGAAVGVASSDVDIDNNAGELALEGFNLAAYGTYYLSQQTYLEGVLSYNRHRYESTRNINFVLNNNAVNAKAQSEPDGQLLAISIGGGYEFFAKQGWVAGTKAKLDYADSTIDAYDETGAGGLNLSIEEQQSDSLMSRLGVQISYAHSTTWGVLLPQFDLDWQHQFRGDAINIKGQFINDQFGTTFQFKTDNPDRDFFGLGLGLSAVFPDGNTVFIQTATTLGRDNYKDYYLAAGARFEF